MNITMIVPYFEPEITAIVHLMSDLAYDFGKYGAKVTVITGFPLRGTDEQTRKEYLKKDEEQIAENVRVIRVGSKREEGSNFIGRGLRYIAKTSALYRKAKQIPTDVYYIYSTPPILGVAGGLLSKKAPTVYSLQDIFPDNLLAHGKLKRSGLITKVLKSMESFIYEKNSHIITISKDMKDNLISKNVNSGKVSIIGNWIDTEDIKYIPRHENHLFDQFQLDREGFYVSYSGNLGFAQDIKIILESAKITQNLEPNIKYIIVGNGVCEAEIRKQIAEENINNVKLYPLQPEKYSAYVYSLGDIGLVTLKQNLHSFAMPSKTWSMMSASQTILCTTEENTELYKIIKGSNSGITVKPGDYNNMANYIISLFHNKQNLKAYGENGRAYVENNLTRLRATKTYFDILKAVTGHEENEVTYKKYNNLARFENEEILNV